MVYEMLYTKFMENVDLQAPEIHQADREFNANMREEIAKKVAEERNSDIRQRAQQISADRTARYALGKTAREAKPKEPTGRPEIF